jgi:hypothetical protein
MPKYPVDLASSPVPTLRLMLRLRQRTTQSTRFTLISTGVETGLGTNENEDAVCILLPAIGHFIVFFSRHLYVHVEEGP